MELDSQIKIQSLQQAESIYTLIVEAYKRPTKRITGDALKVYEDIEAWQWIEKFAIDDPKNKWLYVNMIAMSIYRNLKHLKDNPPTPKRTKWQIVHGLTSELDKK